MFIDLLFHGYEMTRNVLQRLSISYFLTRDLIVSKKFRKDIDKVTVNKETQEERKILENDGNERRGFWWS